MCARGIDAEIINHCMKSGQLIEDAKRHNCVFVGFENGTAKYASYGARCLIPPLLGK